VVVWELVASLKITTNEVDVFLDIVLERFPAMLAYKIGHKSVLINIHKLTLQPETLSALFQENEKKVADTMIRKI